MGNKAHEPGTVTQLELALEYAPQELRGHGYRDAHSYPLVSPDVDKVRRSWRVPAPLAWDYPRLELRTGNSYPLITVDCDGADSVGRLSEFILDEGLPTPNLIVQRKASGNVHAHYMLATPVHRPCRSRSMVRVAPLDTLARVSEYLTAELHGDTGYNGVLTLNPSWPGPEYQTTYLRAWPWEMKELRALIPRGWRRPPVAVTGIGKNVDLFRWAVREAHRPRVAEMLALYGSKDCPDWEAIVAAKNEATYGPVVPWCLPHSEVRSIARSSARYSLQQYDREKFREIQAARARKPRPKRRAGSIEEAAPWEALGVSRATYYRHRETANHNR